MIIAELGLTKLSHQYEVSVKLYHRSKYGSSPRVPRRASNSKATAEDWLEKLVDLMQACCQAVIDANSGQTEYRIELCLEVSEIMIMWLCN